MKVGSKEQTEGSPYINVSALGHGSHFLRKVQKSLEKPMFLQKKVNAASATDLQENSYVTAYLPAQPLWKLN